MTVADLKTSGSRPPTPRRLDVDVPAFIELLVGRIADLDARLR